MISVADLYSWYKYSKLYDLCERVCIFDELECESSVDMMARCAVALLPCGDSIGALSLGFCVRFSVFEGPAYRLFI